MTETKLLKTTTIFHCRWVTNEWGACSTTCGSDGWQQRNVTCQRANSIGQLENVSEQRCLAEQKPNMRRICHSPDCPPQWRTGLWSPVSVNVLRF